MSSTVQELRDRRPVRAGSSNTQNPTSAAGEAAVPGAEECGLQKRCTRDAGSERSHRHGRKGPGVNGTVSQVRIGRTKISLLTKSIRLSQEADQVDAEATQADTQAAVDTLHALQAQFEAV